MLDTTTATLVVTDLKQWVYCPRVFYYHQCLPRVRPVTYSMEAGIAAGQAEEAREERRSLRAYGLTAGEREFNVPLQAEALGLRGEVDMVITLPCPQPGAPAEYIPVDYKLSTTAGAHFKLQLAAYALLLEAVRGGVVRQAFLYFIPARRAERVAIDKRLRGQVAAALKQMQVVRQGEQMPAPTPQLRKCAGCEFRRFCNDVL